MMYAALTVPIDLATGVAAASLSQEPLVDLLTNGGIVTISLGVAWLLLRRSDDRELKIRDSLEKELEDERKGHAETRAELLRVIIELNRRPKNGD